MRKQAADSINLARIAYMLCEDHEHVTFADYLVKIGLSDDNPKAVVVPDVPGVTKEEALAHAAEILEKVKGKKD